MKKKILTIGLVLAIATSIVACTTTTVADTNNYDTTSETVDGKNDKPAIDVEASEVVPVEYVEDNSEDVSEDVSEEVSEESFDDGQSSYNGWSEEEIENVEPVENENIQPKNTKVEEDSNQSGYNR